PTAATDQSRRQYFLRWLADVRLYDRADSNAGIGRRSRQEPWQMSRRADEKPRLDGGRRDDRSRHPLRDIPGKSRAHSTDGDRFGRSIMDERRRSRRQIRTNLYAAPTRIHVAVFRPSRQEISQVELALENAGRKQLSAESLYRGSQPIRDAMAHKYRDLNNFRVIDTLTVN